MRMPEPFWFTYELFDQTGPEIRAYEHEVSVTLPWRRYNSDAYPKVIAESPSIVRLGEEERFGAELCIRRVSRDPQPEPEMAAVMLGELVDAWVRLTVDPVSHPESNH